MLKTLFLKLIRFYQRWISLDQGLPSRFIKVRVCRFEPFCSDYMYQSIEKYGVVRGFTKGIYRVLRCNPFSKGGYDPVK